jgi:hypothetical protein
MQVAKQALASPLRSGGRDFVREIPLVLVLIAAGSGCASYRSAATAGGVGLQLGAMREVASTSAEICWLGQLATPSVECDAAEKSSALWVNALEAILGYSRELVLVGNEQTVDEVASRSIESDLLPSAATDGTQAARTALRALADVLNERARDTVLLDFVSAAAPQADKLAQLLQEHFAIQAERLEAADAQLRLQLAAPDDLRCTVDDEPVALCVNNNAVDNYAYVEARIDVSGRLRAHRNALVALGRFRRANRVFVSEFLASNFDDAETYAHIRATLAVDDFESPRGNP